MSSAVFFSKECSTVLHNFPSLRSPFLFLRPITSQSDRSTVTGSRGSLFNKARISYKLKLQHKMLKRKRRILQKYKTAHMLNIHGQSLQVLLTVAEDQLHPENTLILQREETENKNNGSMYKQRKYRVWEPYLPSPTLLILSAKVFI